MNAYELANELDETEPYVSKDQYVLTAAATMLRQQQAEIEALKKKQQEVLAEVKTSWTAISPVKGVQRESAHQLYAMLKDIMK